MGKQIIIINGTGGSGKDTFVDYCSKYGKVMNFSSIDIIKKIARVAGWKGEKTEEARKYLSELKRITMEYNDLPFNCTRDAVAQFEKSDYEILFIHIREIEEIQRAVDEFKAKTLLIKRAGLSNIQSNSSDANVDNYPYDYIIENDTLEKLDSDALDFVRKLQNEQPEEAPKALRRTDGD